MENGAHGYAEYARHDGHDANSGVGSGLTDADLLAIVLREPFSGFTPVVYAGLSDWQILHVICAQRDEDGVLVPIRQRIAELPLRARARHYQDTPPPTPAQLRIPDAARRLMPEFMGEEFIVMYWQRFLQLKFSPDKILERWQAFAARGFH